MVNKYLYPVGGAETYMFSLAKILQENGHHIEFFGLKNDGNIVGNQWNILMQGYTNKKIFNPLSLVYSKAAKRKMIKLLELFKPDIVHFNNISFDLTSSVIDACRIRNVPAVMTIHDPQLVCCNHMFYRTNTQEVCTKCLDGNFKHCIKNKCLKNSKLKSYLAYLDSKRTHKNNTYNYLSFFISPSVFLKNKLIEGGYDSTKCKHLCNPIDSSFITKDIPEKKDYILYYGRISPEKGVKLLCEAVPDDINLIIAGVGPQMNDLPKKNNIKLVGFKSGEELKKLIKEAKFTVYPSIWYENCPLSVIESIALGTPVIGTNQGGIPELIKDNITGMLFNSNNTIDLKTKISTLYNHKEYVNFVSNCINSEKVTIEKYYSEIIKIYKEAIQNEKAS